MSYSRQLKRLAARAQGVLSEREPEEVERDRDPDPVPKPQPPAKPSLTAVPLDRKRKVPFDDMDDEDLGRALDQAKRRVERTGQSADLKRYEQQVEAIQMETRRRAFAATKQATVQPPPPTAPPRQPEAVDMVFNEAGDAPLPPRPPVPDDDVPPPRPPMGPVPGPNFSEFADDTPESPSR